MRIITGSARGRKLKALEGTVTRPTAERVKEALFSIIQFELPGASVLDLFAGSGQLGIEALSRGAALAVFVDHARDAQTVILENLQVVGLAPSARVVCTDFRLFLQHTTDRFDIALVDPPYEDGLYTEALRLLEPVMKETGIILCESDKRIELPRRSVDFLLKKQYTYGNTTLSVYRKEETV